MVGAPTTVARADERSHAGRTAMAIGIAGWVASAVATALGFFTWHQYDSLEASAHADLVHAYSTAPFGQTPQEQAFFQNPGYVHDCNSGRQYADATTAMFVSGAALAAAGTVSYILGARQAARARGVEVRPAVSLNGAALQLRFPF